MFDKRLFLFREVCKKTESEAKVFASNQKCAMDPIMEMILWYVAFFLFCELKSVVTLEDFLEVHNVTSYKLFFLFFFMCRRAVLVYMQESTKPDGAVNLSPFDDNLVVHQANSPLLFIYFLMKYFSHKKTRKLTLKQIF